MDRKNTLVTRVSIPRPVAPYTPGAMANVSDWFLQGLNWIQTRESLIQIQEAKQSAKNQPRKQKGNYSNLDRYNNDNLVKAEEFRG